MVFQAVPISREEAEAAALAAPSGSSTNPIPTKTASTLENVLTRSPIGGEIKGQRHFFRL